MVSKSKIKVLAVIAALSLFAGSLSTSVFASNSRAVSPKQISAPQIEMVATVNTAELEAFYNSAKNFESSQYTFETTKLMLDALSKAKEVLENPNATQDEVDTAHELLVGEWYRLAPIATDAKTELSPKLNQTQISDNKNDSSGDNKAKTESVNTNPETKIVIDKTYLDQKIKEAATYYENLHKYVDDNGKVEFVSAYQAAQVAYANSEINQADVDSAATRLMFSIFGLRRIPQDKKELQKFYDATKNFEQSLYTQETVDVMIDALGVAKAVLDNVFASQQEIDDALALLQNAWSQLELKVVIDKSYLASKIAEAATYYAKLDKYVDGNGKNEFVSAYQAAQAAYDNSEIEQGDVDSVATRLMFAIFGLREIPNSDNLENLINIA